MSDFLDVTARSIADTIEAAHGMKARVVTYGVVNYKGKDIKITTVAEPTIYLKTVIADGEDEGCIEVGPMKGRKVTTSIVEMLRKEMVG